MQFQCVLPEHKTYQRVSNANPTPTKRKVLGELRSNPKDLFSDNDYSKLQISHYNTSGAWGTR